MAEFETKAIQGGPVEAQIHDLKERGHTEDAVGVYGTSQEFLHLALTTGMIPPQLNTESKGFSQYLSALGVRNGKYIYFAYPFVEKLSEERPDFVEQMVRNHNHLTEDKFYDYALATRYKQSARSYAQTNAITHFFSAVTGIPDDVSGYHDSIIALAQDLIPEKAEETMELWNEMSICQDVTHRDPLENANAALMDQIRANYSEEELQRILQQTLDRRGVLLFYDKRVVDFAVNGWEADDEMVLVTDQELPSEVITGIEEVTLQAVEDDRKMAYHLFETKKTAERKEAQTLRWTDYMIDDEQVYVTDQGLVVVGLTQSSDDPTMFTQDVEGTEVTVSLDRIHKGKEQTVAISITRGNSEYVETLNEVQAIRLYKGEIEANFYERESLFNKGEGVATKHHPVEFGGFSLSSSLLMQQKAQRFLEQMRQRGAVSDDLYLEDKDGQVTLRWNDQTVLRGNFSHEVNILQILRGFYNTDGTFVYYSAHGEKVMVDRSGSLSVLKAEQAGTKA